MNKTELPPVTLQPLGPCDLPVAVAVHAACFDPAWSEKSMAEITAMPGTFGFLAMAGAEPVGLALILALGKEAEILTLGVLPAVRRRGIGRLLLAACADRLARGGGAKLMLEVAQDNVAAQALYRATDFVEAGRRVGYYRRAAGTAVDAILLARVIDSSLEANEGDSVKPGQ